MLGTRKPTSYCSTSCTLGLLKRETAQARPGLRIVPVKESPRIDQELMFPRNATSSAGQRPCEWSQVKLQIERHLSSFLQSFTGRVRWARNTGEDLSFSAAGLPCSCKWRNAEEDLIPSTRACCVAAGFLHLPQKPVRALDS